MEMFLGLEKFQLFFEVLVIPDIFWVNGRCWVRAYVFNCMFLRKGNNRTTVLSYITF